MENLEKITSISINVELMMYGYVGLCITQTNNNIVASWMAVTDGGDVLSNESRNISSVDFKELVYQLSRLTLPTVEDPEMSRLWSISFCDKDDNIIRGVASGYWDIGILEKIAAIIDICSEEKNVTEWLHDIIEA